MKSNNKSKDTLGQAIIKSK